MSNNKFDTEYKDDENSIIIQKVKLLVCELLFMEGRTKQGFHLCIEAMKYLLLEENNPSWAFLIAEEYYYESESIDMIKKYLEIGISYDYMDAYYMMGELCHASKDPNRDHLRAFNCFSTVWEKCDDIYLQFKAGVRVARMLFEGVGVSRDVKKCKSLVRVLRSKAKKNDDIWFLVSPLDELCGDISVSEGDEEKAMRFYEDAVYGYAESRAFMFIRDRFETASIMERIVCKLYERTPYAPKILDITDAYFYLRKPCVMVFTYDKEKYSLCSEEQNGAMVIRFEGKEYEDMDCFLNEAYLGDEPIREHLFDVEEVSVVERKNKHDCP